MESINGGQEETGVGPGRGNHRHVEEAGGEGPSGLGSFFKGGRDEKTTGHARNQSVTGGGQKGVE